MTPDELLCLHLRPAAAGRRAAQRRAEFFGDAIWIRNLPTIDADPGAWPQNVSDGQDIVLQVDAHEEGRDRFATWLCEVGPTLPQGASLAPFSTEAAGLHRLWCLAAARLALPAHVRVQVRHDVVGIRLAQIALGFGVDTFGGPLQSDRKLPLAGVTRPDEATRAGLSTLIRSAGLRPVLDPFTDSTTDPATNKAAS